MYNYAFPHKENKLDDYNEMLANEDAKIEAQEMQAPILDQPKQQAPPPIPQVVPNKSTTQEDYMNTLSPSSVTSYNPQAYAQADDMFLKNLQGYKEAMPEKAITDRYKNVSDYFTANYPDADKSMQESDKRLQAGMFARAFNDLGNAVGGAIGNKGGRARIQREDYSPFERDLTAYKNAVSQRGAMAHKKAIAQFEQGLKGVQGIQQGLLDRDASAYKYATDSRNKYLDSNKVTYNNSLFLNQERIKNTNQQKDKDRDIYKKREAGLNARHNETMANRKADKKTYILPKFQAKGKASEVDEAFVSDLFYNIAEQNKNNPNLTKIPREIYVDKESKIIYSEPTTMQEKQAVLNILAKEHKKEYVNGVIETKLSNF